jgi:exo-beta-1,3-glucanase (GH17 family)
MRFERGDRFVRQLAAREGVIKRCGVLLAAAGLLLGCGASRSAEPSGGKPAPAAEPTAKPQPQGDDAVSGQGAPIVRRPFAPTLGGRRLYAGVGYGPYREGQRPGGAGPTPAQILEDLRLIARRWQIVRIYSSRGPTEDILRALRDNDLPLKVVLGAWIEPNKAEDNAAEVAELIRLAGTYADQVVGVNVGNETQVYWSAHRSPREDLIALLRKVRAAVIQPVSTADDYNFWNKPESRAVAAEVDFMLLHAYAMWNRQSLANAVSWTRSTVEAIAREHPELTVVLAETGWATQLNTDGDEVKHIKAPAGEAEQAIFFSAFTAWAAEAQLPYFFFEAFDEPWKGGADPRDVEKHWGLYHVNRTPKAAMSKESP